MRGRASLELEIFGSRRNFWSFIFRFLAICKFVWPPLIFGIFICYASFVSWSMAFWESLDLENEWEIDFDLKKKMASKSQIWHFHEEFYDRSQCIQKSSEALARVSQFQFGKFWADSVIKMSLFENSSKWRHRDFRVTKNQLVVIALILAPMTRKAFLVSGESV